MVGCMKPAPQGQASGLSACSTAGKQQQNARHRPLTVRARPWRLRLPRERGIQLRQLLGHVQKRRLGVRRPLLCPSARVREPLVRAAAALQHGSPVLEGRGGLFRGHEERGLVFDDPHELDEAMSSSDVRVSVDGRVQGGMRLWQPGLVLTLFIFHFVLLFFARTC